MKFTLITLLLLLFSYSHGQSIQVRVDSINLNFPKNKIIKSVCHKQDITLQSFYDNVQIDLFSTNKIKSLGVNHNQNESSSIFISEWDNSLILITLTKWPKTIHSLNTFILTEIMSISNDIGSKYDIGLEIINNKNVYWVRELVPDLEYNSFSTMFYIYLEKSEIIYLLDFTIFKKFNCYLNNLMIDVIKSLDWECFESINTQIKCENYFKR